jgi:hypothetical protein
MIRPRSANLRLGGAPHCGKSIFSEKQNRVDFIVSKFGDIEEKLIPFFNKYYLQGSKRLDYADFCKIAPPLIYD